MHALPAAISLLQCADDVESRVDSEVVERVEGSVLVVRQQGVEVNCCLEDGPAGVDDDLLLRSAFHLPTGCCKGIIESLVLPGFLLPGNLV